MKEFEKISIAQGVDIISVPANRFKTNEISISFLTPLKEETASSNALLAYLVSQTTRRFPSITEFNQRLAMLYGAGVSVVVSKLGENQCISLSISSLDDRFALDNEKISAKSFELLINLIFEPKTDENGCFYPEDMEREKRLLCEKLESEDNDKRTYALRQLEKNMFSQEPYAINRYGTIASIHAVTNKDLKKSLAYFKSNAKIQITVVGNADIHEIKRIASQHFCEVKRAYIPPVQSVFKPVADEEVKTITERIDVKQGKLVLGFRVNDQSNFKSNPEMRLFCDVFGGGPYSKLFANVREKLSLCYYCSARYDRRKSNVIIQCGCEEENMEKAVKEILKQLKEIEKGNIEDGLNASKMALSDAINSVNDDSISLLNWYVNQITDEKILTPYESAKENEKADINAISACARLLSLDTIYKLVEKKEGA